MLGKSLGSLKVEIDDNREKFYPGEKIRGVVVVDVAKSMKCNKINAILAGYSYCHYERASFGRDSNGNSFTRIERDKKQNGYQLLVELQALLFGGSLTGAEQHPSGRHSYRFEFQLPLTLPTSFEADGGQIHYYIKATVYRPWKLDYKTRKPFTVNEIIDVNLPRYSTVPVDTRETQIRWLFRNVGSMNIRASLDRSGYFPGEYISLNALCMNMSTRTMRSMRATLVQKYLYRFDDGRTAEVVREITSFEGERIRRRGQDLWDNQTLHIPPVPPTIQTNPVSVSYQVVFEVKVPWGCGENPKIALDITIGTVPFRQTHGGHCLHQPAENQVMEGQFPGGIKPSAATSFAPSSSTLGYYGMPPPSYAETVGGLPVNVGDTETELSFGDQSYVPKYTYARP